MRSKIIICIPIALASRQAIAAALANKYDSEYVFLGRAFKSTVRDESCGIEILAVEDAYCDRADLKADFAFAEDKFNAATLQRIDCCRQLIYLSSNDTSYDVCLTMGKLTQILLSIGGVAVKVESAGIFHTKEKWLANYSSDDVFEIYSLYVGLVEGDQYYYSVGMHHFGKADVAVAIDLDIGLAIYVMNVFNYYRLTESPILQDGHTFRPDIECPSYQIRLLEEWEHLLDDERYNSHGRWLLSINS